MRFRLAVFRTGRRRSRRPGHRFLSLHADSLLVRTLGKKKLHALQLSERGGELFCADRGERVTIGGRAVTYMSGTLRI